MSQSMKTKFGFISISGASAMTSLTWYCSWTIHKCHSVIKAELFQHWVISTTSPPQSNDRQVPSPSLNALYKVHVFCSLMWSIHESSSGPQPPQGGVTKN
jgi:hypothetical protein